MRVRKKKRQMRRRIFGWYVVLPILVAIIGIAFVIFSGVATACLFWSIAGLIVLGITGLIFGFIMRGGK